MRILPDSVIAELVDGKNGDPSGPPTSSRNQCFGLRCTLTVAAGRAGSELWLQRAKDDGKSPLCNQWQLTSPEAHWAGDADAETDHPKHLVFRRQLFFEKTYVDLP